ncbi:amidase [Alphaproteobacteria bacterium]|nr:amidase [Alphaproteobacteria bacterium]
MKDSLNTLTATEVAQKIAAGELSAEGLVRSCLDQVNKREQTIGAWEYIDTDTVIAEAKQRDSEQPRGPLHGIPVGIKDIIDTADMPTRLGSPIYAKNQPDADAACVAAIRSAGAIIMGKTVTTEFATFTPGKTVNPHNIMHTPGGSSSGSAAAVADFMVPVAYGTQTSGSVIRPSSFCGLCGFKPSFGAVSRQGVLTIVPSFDCVGYMARCFDDISLTHRVVTGKQTLPLNDGLDRTPHIGICRSHQWSQADPASTEALEVAAQRVAELGAKTENIALPAHFSGLEAAHATIMDVALAQSLKREFDEHHDLLSDRLLERMERGIATSTNKFMEALALAARCRTEITPLLANWDGFLTPSAVGEAPKGFKITGVPTFNLVWTLLHLPCITVPGFTGSSGLPVGVQIVAGLGGDLSLLALGKWLHTRLIDS